MVLSRTTPERSLRPRARTSLAAALLLTGGLSWPLAAAQEATECGPISRPLSISGWIGVSLSQRIEGDDRGRRTASDLLVSCVMEGSPASEWLRPGDRILRVNGRLASMRSFGEVARSLDPGDPLALTLERPGGSRADVTIIAGDPPDDPLRFLPRELVVRIEGLVEQIEERDSVWRTLEGDLRGTWQLTQGSEGGGVRLSLGRGEVPAATRDSQRVRGPTFSGDGTLLRIRGRDQDESERERSALGDALVSLSPWVRFFPLEEFEPHLVGDRSLFTTVASPDEERALFDGATPFESNFTVREPSPLHFVGERNLLAGARLTPLVPHLAEYFTVDEGLLVTDVIAGTPAADVGLRAGDVVVEVGGHAARTMEALREAWAVRTRRGADSVSLTVVRRGERLEVKLAG